MGNLLSKLKKENNNSIHKENNNSIHKENNNSIDKENNNSIEKKNYNENYSNNIKNNDIYSSPKNLWRPPTPPKPFSNKGLNNIK